MVEWPFIAPFLPLESHLDLISCHIWAISRESVTYGFIFQGSTAIRAESFFAYWDKSVLTDFTVFIVAQC